MAIKVTIEVEGERMVCTPLEESGLTMEDIHMNLEEMDRSPASYEEAERIFNSGEEFDPSRPIVVDAWGMILDGNHRWEVFEREGFLHEVTVVMLA